MNALIMLTVWPLVSELAAHDSVKGVDGERVDRPITKTMSAAVPLDPDSPVIVVKYYNEGKLPFRLDLPGTKREIQTSGIVSLKIDDQKAETVAEPWILRLSDIKPTRRVELGAGE